MATYRRRKSTASARGSAPPLGTDHVEHQLAEWLAHDVALARAIQSAVDAFAAACFAGALTWRVHDPRIRRELRRRAAAQQTSIATEKRYALHVAALLLRDAPATRVPATLARAIVQGDVRIGSPAAVRLLVQGTRHYLQRAVVALAEADLRADAGERGSEVPIPDQLPAPRVDLLERLATRDEQARRLELVAAAIPPRTRQCLELLVAGYSKRDLAAAMGISPATADVYFYQLRAIAGRGG